MNYFDYNSIEWKKKRAEILIRDRFRCQFQFDECQEIAIEIHHINGAFANPEIAWEDWNLLSACSSCHDKFLQMKKYMSEKIEEKEIETIQ